MFDTGNSAWIMTTCALVLLMTIPGIILYYAGMVRVQHVLASAMQTFSIVCLISFLWLCIGYSLCFTPTNGKNGNPVIGDSSRMWLIGMEPSSYHSLAPTIPESVFCVRQLAFAIITSALISGSFAHRMKYGSMLLFIALWHIFVYCPIAHANWHPCGFLYKLGVLDFAGGNVVHISAGTATLVASIVVGNRGFSIERFEPHNVLLTVMGACFLWIGWLGFNAGSFGTADGRAGFAILMTQISSSCGALTWMFTEWYFKDFPTILGMLSGSIAGLLAITPAAGYVDQTGAFIIGTLAGPICYFGVQIKHSLGVEDGMDAFGLHAIGGSLGGILLGFFAKERLADINGIIYGGNILLGYQIAGVLVSIGWSASMTFILLHSIDRTIGLRRDPDIDDTGIDSSHHGGPNRSQYPTGARDDDLSNFNASVHRRRVSPRNSRHNNNPTTNTNTNTSNNNNSNSNININKNENENDVTIISDQSRITDIEENNSQNTNTFNSHFKNITTHVETI